MDSRLRGNDGSETGNDGSETGNDGSKTGNIQLCHPELNSLNSLTEQP
ncbi:hypothetical protein [Endozoicomonas sp. ALB122]